TGICTKNFGSAVFVHHLMIKSSIMSWNFKNKKCAFVALPIYRLEGFD
ncbi:MAG: hypothetical protein ACI8P3_004105, partial [Saprospiraceae bacterium]